MKKIIIMMGPPGSGKGTQAKKIAAKHGYVHVSSGDLLRALALKSELTSEERGALEKIKFGMLVPNEFMYKLVLEKIVSEITAGRTVVLDGFPRRLEQAIKLQQFFTDNNLLHEVLVLEITLSDEEAFNRLTSRRVCSRCGEILPAGTTRSYSVCPKCSGELVIRHDDNPDIIKERIAKQGNVVLAPIINFYRELQVVRTVEGSQSIEQVEQDIENILQ